MNVLADAIVPASGNAQLVAAALLGIAAVVVLISGFKMHPFLALILGTGVLGVVAGFGVTNTIDSFTKGVGSTVGSVGLLIALGAMIGGLLADSGGADRIVEAVVDHVSAHRLPWAMGGVAALIGLPLFFEVGVVLLVPIVVLVSIRSRINLLVIGIPALAGLSVLHGLVPPHPGPLVAIDALKADLGTTLALGLIIAIPTVILAGPVFGSIISRYVVIDAPRSVLPEHELAGAGAPARADLAPGDDLVEPGTPAARSGQGGSHAGGGSTGGTTTRATSSGATSSGATSSGATTGGATAGTAAPARRRPDVVPTVLTMLLPIVLMLLRAVAEVALDPDSTLAKVLIVAGTPVIALLAGVLVAMFTLGARVGMDRGEISASLGGALPGIAGILLIVAAGGGFKQTLIDAGVGEMVGKAAQGASLSPLVLGWLVAVGIRLATGSATVATITAAGIVAPLASTLDKPGVALLALAIGSGSLFFSHVNDAGFWLVKEYFGMTVGQTLKTWSVMETIIAVCGLVFVLLLNVVV
ncbi:MAG TPA: SLC13 family permease [Actinomycetales bacterium]|nr:SLC13 family permease [Actinomycetales bacterium]